MKRITKKHLLNFLNEFTVIKQSRIPDDEGMVYHTKIDDSYVTRVGMEEEIKFLLKLGITEQIQSANNDGSTISIGFNPIEQKWYGWSHRAIYGFGINSKCKKGNVGFRASNKEEYIEEIINFWKDEKYNDYIIAREIIKNGVECIKLEKAYNNKIPNKSLRGTIGISYIPYPDKWGKGEWTAKTLDEAKQMAIDFANDIS